MALSRPQTALLAGLALLLGAETAAPQPSSPPGKGLPTEVRGEVVEIGCYLRDGSHGPDHKNCALRCLDRGGRVGIVEDRTGTLYPLASRQPASVPSERFRDLIASHVSVRGRLYQRAGSRVLVAEEIQPMQPGSTLTR